MLVGGVGWVDGCVSERVNQSVGQSINQSVIKKRLNE